MSSTGKAFKVDTQICPINLKFRLFNILSLVRTWQIGVLPQKDAHSEKVLDGPTIKSINKEFYSQKTPP